MLQHVLNTPARYPPIGKLAALFAFVAVVVPMRPLGFQAEHYGAVEVGVLSLLALAGFFTGLMVGSRWPLWGLLAVPSVVCGLSFVCHYGFIGLRRAGVPVFPRWHLWWVAGLILAVLLYLAVRWLTAVDPRVLADRQYIREHGRRLLAWIVRQRERRVASYTPVMVVFTYDTTIPNLPDYLKELAGRLSEMRFGQPANADEDEVRRLHRDFKEFLNFAPMPVPPALTGGREVFCANAIVRHELLPDGKTPLPYCYVLAAADKPHMPLEMVAYPAETAPGCPVVLPEPTA